MVMINKSEKMDNTDQVILGSGSDCIYSSDCNITGINNNVLVVGGSGSGKTVSIAEPFLLESKNRNIITSVTKRRIVDKYTQLLKKRGYHVLDLNFVNPTKGNISYDPLAFINSEQDLQFVAKTIVFSNSKYENIQDPYWYMSATSLFIALISYVFMKVDNPNFSDVLDMVDTLDIWECSDENSRCIHLATSHDSCFDEIGEEDPKSLAYVNWLSFKRLPIRTAGCVLSFLKSSTTAVFTPELKEMFRMKHKINFSKFLKEKTALFITNSPVNPSINTFINMFYAHTFKELFELGEIQSDGRLPIPVHFLADDFATGCPVPLFDQYISIFREKGISTTLLIQSESQLSSLYGPVSSTTIINNCDTYVYMGSNDLVTAKNIAERADITTNDCLNIKLGNQIIFRRGLKPKLCKRYNTFENKLYRDITKKFDKAKTKKIVTRKKSSFINRLKYNIRKTDNICGSEL